MRHLTALFLASALIAGFFAFGGFTIEARNFATFLFFLFLVLAGAAFVLSVVDPSSDSRHE